jgi:hypothetical protein
VRIEDAGGNLDCFGNDAGFFAAAAVCWTVFESWEVAVSQRG